ncbi:MAG: YegS/Rv2252/BmrU family lipid kinase [Halanaerobiales bacterium]|nr:YegS/Rv2252/BmrU family lipid kinase [Halanaerobiales bacterium]
MKKVKLIYNPYSGTKDFPNYLDLFLEKFQGAGYKVDIYRSMEKNDLHKGLVGIDNSYEKIIVAGGDGSVNEIVNDMMNQSIDIPLGIIPSGTVNDFASFLNIPNNYEKCFDMLLTDNINSIDVGEVNEKYFINVCVGGLFSSISHEIDINLKNTFGKLAYYINGLREIPKIKAIPFKIKTSNQTIDEDLFMFFVLNSKRAGGFQNLAKFASINDGMFDFIGVKTNQLYRLPTLLMNLLDKENFTSKNFIYVQDNYFKIEIDNDKADTYNSNIDGEKGPKFPLEIKLHHNAIQMINNINQ